MNTKPKNQLTLATWFSLGFSFIMASVLIGLIIEGINCPLSPSFLFFAAMAAIHILGALLHGDIYAIICGVVYFLFIPSCFIFLQIYSIANLNDCSWGKYFLREPRILQRALCFQYRDNSRIAPLDGPYLAILK